MKGKLDKSKADPKFKVSDIVDSMFEKIIAEDVQSSGGIGCDNMTCAVITLGKKY